MPDGARSAIKARPAAASVGDESARRPAQRPVDRGARRTAARTAVEPPSDRRPETAPSSSMTWQQPTATFRVWDADRSCGRDKRERNVKMRPPQIHVLADGNISPKRTASVRLPHRRRSPGPVVLRDDSRRRNLNKRPPPSVVRERPCHPTSGGRHRRDYAKSATNTSASPV